MLFFLSNTQFVSLTEANPKPYFPTKITIVSPSPNEVYNSSSVLLNVTVTIYGVTFPPWDNVTSLSYSLDGQQDIPIAYSRGPNFMYYYGKATLSNLSDGPHSILVHGENIPFYVTSRSSGGLPVYSEKTTFNATVSFTVNVQTTDDFQENILGLPPLTSSAIAVSVAVAAVVVVSVVVFLKKRKPTNAEGRGQVENLKSPNIRLLVRGSDV